MTVERCSKRSREAEAMIGSPAKICKAIERGGAFGCVVVYLQTPIFDEARETRPSG